MYGVEAANMNDANMEMDAYGGRIVTFRSVRKQ